MAIRRACRGATGMRALLALAITLTAGCTGPAQRSAEPPRAPVLSVVPGGTKLVVFGWTDVEGETEYRLREDPDGTGDYATIAVLPADTTSFGLELFLPTRGAARYLLTACNQQGCSASEPLSVGALLTALIGDVRATNATEFAEFGFSLALSADGSTLVVGSRHEHSDASGVGGDQHTMDAEDSGAVYVYVRGARGAWTFQEYIKATNPGFGHAFGTTLGLAADGNTLVVGAPFEWNSATGVGGAYDLGTLANSGAVYVYVRDATGAWRHQAYVKASNTGEFDAFGTAVALSADGNTLAVGAPGEDSNARDVDGDQGNELAQQSGAVYVYQRNAAQAWTFSSYVKATNSAAADAFGSTVALSADGSTLAVGAPREASSAVGVGGDQNDDSAFGSGAVYVYARSGTGSWAPHAYVKATNTGAGDAFGSAVALSADGATLAVGAPREDSNARGVDGDQMNDLALDSGAVYLYSRTSAGQWTPRAYVKATNTRADARFGSSVALSAEGTLLAVGAPREASAATGLGGDQSDVLAPERGAVFVYQRDTASGWSERAYVKASTAGEAGQFGHAVALSGDGRTLAAGAPYASVLTGAAYLY
jgi:trimeric autotransporter adhesin